MKKLIQAGIYIFMFCLPIRTLSHKYTFENATNEDVVMGFKGVMFRRYGGRTTLEFATVKKNDFFIKDSGYLCLQGVNIQRPTYYEKTWAAEC